MLILIVSGLREGDPKAIRSIKTNCIRYPVGWQQELAAPREKRHDNV